MGRGLLGAGVLVVGFLVIDGSSPFPGLSTLLPVLGSLLLIIGGPGAGPVGTVLRSGPAVWIGDVSYSIYLWHWPFVVFAQALGPAAWWPPALGAAFSVLPAVLTYRTVEQRWRPAGGVSGASGRSFGVLWRLAMVTILVPAVLSAGLWWGAQSGWGSARITQQQAVSAQAHVGFRPCMDQRAGGGPAPVECRWFAERPGPTVHLVGDSNAGQYSEAVLAAAAELDSPVHVSTASACAYADVYRVTPGHGMGADDRACRAWFERTAAELAQEPPGVVVLAMSMIHWLYAGRAMGSTAANATRHPATRGAFVDAGVVAAIHGLEASGHRVVMVEPMIWLPDAQVAMTTCPSTLSILSGSCPHDVTNLASTQAAQAPIRTRLRALIEEAGAVWLPITDRQCPQDRCPAFLGPELVYLDAGHLSAGFSRGLTPRFTAVLRTAVDALRPPQP